MNIMNGENHCVQCDVHIGGMRWYGGMVHCITHKHAQTQNLTERTRSKRERKKDRADTPLSPISGLNRFTAP